MHGQVQKSEQKQKGFTTIPLRKLRFETAVIINDNKCLIIHSHFRGRPFRDNETIIQIEHNIFKNLNWKEANQLAITIVAEDLNSGLPRINPTSGQGGT